MKALEQRVRHEPDLMTAKTILTDDLKERFDAHVSFTMYQEIYNCFPSYRNNMQKENYADMMKDKYISVYHAVKKRLEDRK